MAQLDLPNTWGINAGDCSVYVVHLLLGYRWMEPTHTW